MLCCVLGFLLGLIFVQRSGSYFVSMFDDYSATLPLLIVVAFEAFAMAWIYGADRWVSTLLSSSSFRPPPTSFNPLLTSGWVVCESTSLLGCCPLYSLVEAAYNTHTAASASATWVTPSKV